MQDNNSTSLLGFGAIFAGLAFLLLGSRKQEVELKEVVTVEQEPKPAESVTTVPIKPDEEIKIVSEEQQPPAN